MSGQQTAAAVVGRAVVLPDAFTPYVWAPKSHEVAARHGLRVEQVVRFDQNTPPFPGVPQIPLAQSFAHLNEYPDGQYRALREAAAGYVGGLDWSQIVVGAGADQIIYLCARTFLAPGRRAAISNPTYVVYEEASQLAGADVGEEIGGADLIWRCNPNNPTGEAVGARELVALAAEHPDIPVVVDEAYVEFGGESVVPFLDEAPNLIAIRTLSKAFGFAARPVGRRPRSPRARRRNGIRGRREPPLGDGDPDDDRDGAARHARPGWPRPDEDRHRDRLPRPPADAPHVPRRIRSGVACRRRSRRRRAPHRRGRSRLV